MTATKDTHGAIVAANEVFMATYSKADSAALADLYTDDAEFLIPNTDFIKGRPAIQATLQAFLDSGVRSITLVTREVEDFGHTATEMGEYLLRDTAGQVSDKGKYIVIWKLKDGQWKIHRDMINSSMPA